MVFRQCSVGGVAYRGDSSKVRVSADENDRVATVKVLPAGSSSSGVKSNLQDSDDIIHFHDCDLNNDLVMSENSDPETRRHARNLNGFFTVLALCHTVLAAEDSETHCITYKAQSPDEAALVQAAADVGYQFLGRDRDILSLRSPSSEDIEKYELLNILEFTSTRKRMSVVVRRIDGDDHRLFLMTKGADNVIFERLKDGVDEDIREDTERHLSQFANEGLRTLTLAYKVINSKHLFPPEDSSAQVDGIQ